jgi:hypothetical protein
MFEGINIIEFTNRFSSEDACYGISFRAKPQ